MSTLCTTDLGLAEELFEDIQESKLAGMPITLYQLLDIATKIRANNLFQTANVVSCTDVAPTALEKIAMEIPKAFEALADSIYEVAKKLNS